MYPVRSVPLIALGLLVALGPATRAMARDVRLGVVDVEPLAFWQDDQPAGLFVDLLTDVAAREGWQVTTVPVDWDEGMARLAAGELDLMPTVAFSAERDSILDFCTEHVVTLWSQVYRREGESLETVFELAGERVAVMRGDMNATNFERLIERFGVSCELIWVSSLEEAFASTRDGRTAAAVAPNVFGYTHADSFGLAPSPILFAPFAVYFATTSEQNQDLIAALDAALREWRRVDDSFYFQRLNHWLGQSSDSERLPPWVLATLIVSGIFVVALIAIIRGLERRVRRRTRDLETSELRFRAVFDSAGDAILLLQNGRFIECNPRSLELYGCEREELIGKRPDDFSPPTQPDGQPSDMAATTRIASARPGQRVTFEWQHQRPDGTLFDAEVTLSDFSVQGQRYVQAFVRDVTRRKQLEADLRQAQKMEAIGTLAGGIAHDFNNILSVIMGYAELIRSENADRAELLDYLGQISRASERARGLVQQILTFSRRSAENKGVVELNEIVEEALVLLRSSIPTTIEIRYESTTHGRVFADPTSLHQIMMNLCTNAYHALEATGGLIEVRLEIVAGDFTRPGRWLALTVSDNGPGISSDVLPKIFEPYFTTKDADRGTGLGLAVVHGIVEDHGGSIDVDSRPGQGATFRVLLPETTRVDRPAEELEVLRPAAGGERLLLVDDEADLVDVFERGLTRLGYQVTAFTEPGEALAAMKRDPEAFDVLVTDMTMPEMTGAALTAAALAIRPDLPVIICTGYSEGLTVESVRAMGAQDLVMKPVAVNRLAHRVRMMLASLPPR